MWCDNNHVRTENKYMDFIGRIGQLETDDDVLR